MVPQTLRCRRPPPISEFLPADVPIGVRGREHGALALPIRAKTVDKFQGRREGGGTEGTNVPGPEVIWGPEKLGQENIYTRV